MNLYYVRAEMNEPGDLDLFVRAVTPKAALSHWYDYFERSRRDRQSDLIALYRVPDGDQPGAINWKHCADHLTEALS